MITNCPKCGANFNDVEFSTICPHDHIDGNYCRTHDLFNCSVCKGEKIAAADPRIISVKGENWRVENLTSRSWLILLLKGG